MVGGACPSNETTSSNKVAQSEIYQSYTVRENGQNYEITAFFRIGGETGTTLALSLPSKILFNGQPLKENLNTSSGTYYTITVPNSTTVGNFEFTNRQGKVYKNRIDLRKIAMSPKPLTINAKNPAEVQLSQSVAENLGLTLQLENQNGSSSVMVGSIFDASLNQSNNGIVIKPQVWENFDAGKGRLKLDVTQNFPTQQGTNLGGKMIFAYQTPAVNFVLQKPAVARKTVAKKNNR